MLSPFTNNANGGSGSEDKGGMSKIKQFFSNSYDVIYPDESAVQARLSETMKRADQRIAEFNELSKKMDKQLEKPIDGHLPTSVKSGV